MKPEAVTRTLSWGEAREAHEQGREVRLKVGDKEMHASGFDGAECRLDCDGVFERVVGQVEVEFWGGVFEVDEPARPHGTIPTEQGAMILVGGGLANREDDDSVPWVYRGDWYSDGEMQRKVDECGFERLVPESEVAAARSEGWGDGVRSVWNYAHERGYPFADEIRGEFAQVFWGVTESEPEESKPKREGLSVEEAMAYEGPGRIFDKEGDEWRRTTAGVWEWRDRGGEWTPDVTHLTLEVCGPFRVVEGGDDE